MSMLLFHFVAFIKDSFAQGSKFLGGENGLESWEVFAAIVKLTTRK
jgi:hypothetical protein